MAFPNYHVPLSRSACQSARNAGSSRRSTAHRRIYDCYRRPLSVFLCLLPFGKRITPTSKLFVSWVGLRGAVPIIFATYPVVADVPGADVIFNIVFFITILSLVIQGTTVSKVARLLGLSTPMEKTGNDFGIELPEEIDSDLRDVTVTQEMLDKKGDTLKNMNLPQGTLVMIVKRGNEYLIPNGTLKLQRKRQVAPYF